MCRLAAYVGPELRLERLLLEPSYGLMQQAVAPREMREGKLNADGYGFGWYAPDGRPAIYTHPMPIWTDPNLYNLGRTLVASQWLAAVRSATRNMDISHANTQPFYDDNLLFMHNGYVADFARTVRTRLRLTLRPDFEDQVHGNTDSEYLFAIFRQEACDCESGTIEEGLTNLVAMLSDWLEPNIRGLFNFLIGDGRKLYATRYAVNGYCPSLYYATDEESYPDATLIASEPLTASSAWKPVPENHLLIAAAGEPVELQAL